MKGLIIYFLNNSQDDLLIKTARKKFTGTDVVFIDNPWGIFPSETTTPEEINYMKTTDKVVVIDSRKQCCSANLVHNVARAVKMRNESAKLLAITTHDLVDERLVDKIFKTPSRFSENVTPIFQEITKWFG